MAASLQNRTSLAPETAIAVVVALAAFWLRLSTLTVESLWWDEVITLQQTRGSFADLIRLTAADNYPPLHNIIVQFSLRLFGETEFALRIPSAILGSLTVLLIYWVGSLLNSRVGGLVAAILLTVAGFHIWYSQEARSYALLCFAATAYAATVLWLAAKPTWPRIILTVLSCSALLYSHPYGLFTFGAIAAAMLVILIVERGPWLRFAIIQAVAAATFIPWALILLNRAEAINDAGFWIPAVTPFRVFYYMMQLVTGPVVLVAVLAGAGMLLVRPRSLRQIVFLGAWALGPLIAGIVLSALTQPLLVQRYLIGSLPALLLIASIGFAKPTGIIRIAGFAVLALVGFTSYTGFGPPGRTDFRGIAEELDQKFAEGDCLLIWSWAWIGLDHYWSQTPACLKITEGGYADVDLSAEHPRRIFVVLTNDEPTDNPVLNALGSRAGLTDYAESRLLEIAPNP